MKTTCVLSESDIKNLYVAAGAGMNEALLKGAVFSPSDFMQIVFDKFNKKNDPLTGALFIQQLPSIIGTIAIKPSMRGLKLNKSIDLSDLRDDFLDPTSGLDNVLKMFNPVANLEDTKNLIALGKENELNNQNEKKPQQKATIRLAAYSPFGLTMQMYKERKPEDITDFEIEKLDPSKDRIYNTLYNIKNSLPEGFTVMDDVIYQGTNLVLHPYVLTSLPQDQLDDYAVKKIIRSATLKKKGFGNNNVTEANEMIAMVLFDKTTNRIVLFDENGNVSKDGNGKLVYQFLRDVRQENNKYRVTDIYGISDTVISPTQIVENEIAELEITKEEFEKQLNTEGKSIVSYTKEIEDGQQEQFKMLADIKKSVLSGKPETYSIVGISEGLNIGYVTKDIKFNELTNIPGVTNSVYQTLKIIKSPRDGFASSTAVVTINDREFKVNRPNMDADLINKIAAVLTNPKITDSQKNIFISQFSVNLKPEIQRHSFYYNKTTGVFSFYYTPYTVFKAIKEKLNNKPVKLVLTNSDAFDKIVEVLTYAFKENGKYKSSYMKFEPKLNGKTFSDYDVLTGKFIRANYTDFIKQYPTLVKINPLNKLGIFNSYIMFRPNTGFTKTLNKAKEETKDVVVDSISFGNQPTQSSTSVKKGVTELFDSNPELSNIGTQEQYSQYLDTIFPDSQVKDIVYHNTIEKFETFDKSKLISDGFYFTPNNKAYKNVGNVKMSVLLNLKNPITDAPGLSETINKPGDTKRFSDLGYDGIIDLDGLDEYIIFEPEQIHILSSKQDIEGFKQFVSGKLTTQPSTSVESDDVVTSSLSFESENFTTKESINFPVTPTIEEGIQPTDTIGPEDENTEVGKLYNRFKWDRSSKLPNAVTIEQIEAARVWYKNSPLSKIIGLPHIANIVNSDSFASFIISGATLADTSITIDEKKGGTMVDVYHEAWHGFSQLFLTKKQKTDLYNEVKYFKDTKGNQPNINKTFFEIEEMLAEDFRDYAKNPKILKGTPKRNTIFRKILNFLKALFNKVFKREQIAGDVTLIPSVQELYSKLYLASENETNAKELLNIYKPNVNNAMFSMLDRGVNSVTDKQSEVLNFQDSSKLVNSIDSIISENIDNTYADSLEVAKQFNDDKIASKAGAVKILTDERNKKEIYIIVKEDLEKRYNEIITDISRIENVKELSYELEKLKDAARIIKLGLENFGDETKGLVKYHIENSTFDIVRQKFTEINYAEEEEENKTVVEEAQTSERFGDKIVNEKSLQQLASKETIYILKSLFKKNGKNFVYNELGFKELADFTTTWNNVTRAIGGIKDRVEMYEQLKVAARTFPELNQLIDYKLPDPTKLLDKYEFKVSSAFWQDFKKPRITYIQLTAFKEGNDYELEVTEASIETSSILRKFQNKFKADTDNIYTTRVNNVNALNLKKIVDKFGRRDTKTFDSSQSFEFANAIGIYLDDLPVIKEQLNNSKEYYSLQYIYEAVKALEEIERLSDTKVVSPKVTKASLKVLGEFKLDPLAVLKKGIPAGVISEEQFKQKNIIERFAELQGRYGADSSNFSVLNAERNLVSEHIEDHSVSMIVHGLNKAKNLQDLWESDQLQYMSYLNPQINSFTLRSKILNSLFAIDTETYEKRPGKSLELNYVSGTQIADGSEGSNTTSLDIYSKFLQEMHMMLKGGLQEFMRHASKSSSFGVRVSGDIIGGIEKQEDGHLYLDIDMFAPQGVAEEYAVNEFFIDYIDVELERIQMFNANIELFKNYTGYNRVLEYDSNNKPKVYAGQVFTAFDNVLTENTKNFIYKNIKEGTLKDYLEKNPEFKNVISDEIKNYFISQSLSNERYLEDINYVDPKLLKRLTGLGLKKNEAVQALVKAFTYNSWIHNFETASLIYGDIVQYNHAKEELHKRNSGSTSGGPGFLTDVYAQKFVNGFIKNTSYANNLSKLTNFGPKILDWEYNGTFNTAILRDIKRKSVYLDQIEIGLTKDYTLKLSKSLSGDKLKKEVDRRVAIDLDAYTKMEEADAQGYLTFDAYRTLRYLENNWSDKQEALFQDVINGKEIPTSVITEFFPAYKIQNFGHLANTELPVNAMHKYALFPLIPNVIKGSDLESLHNQMMMKGIQYATFQTGSKVGSITKDGVADQIYNDETDQKTLKSDIEFTPNVVYLEYLKNVTSVPNKFKKKTVFSTQLRKLILEGLYEQGLITYDNIKDAVKEYEDTVDAYSEILKIQLLEEIGYEYVDGKYIGNLGDFLKVVRNELERRELPEHHIKFINVNENNTIKTDLSLHLEADEIEKILVSLIEKRLVKQKVKGESLVQVSSGLTNGLWSQSNKFTGATEENIRKYMGSNNLPFYDNANGKTSAMKVAIAMQGDFENLFALNHPDNKKIRVLKDDGSVDFDKSLERLNEAIKDDDWLAIENNRKGVTLTAVRIPVQGLNSMEFMEVHHFLHPDAGNIIIPPSEIVAKSGADFDVDKLTTFMPSIDENGTFRISSDDFNNESLNRVIYNIKKTNDPNKKTQILRIIEERKRILENKLISSIKGILELPENYANLVRPNSTYLLKEIADDLESSVADYDKFANEQGETARYIIEKDGKTKKVISPTRTLEINYNLHKHDVNIVGKAGLGIVAIENSLSPIFNALGAKMPLTYKPVYFDTTRQRYVEDKFAADYKMRLRLNHNTTQDGNISLSNILNVEGDSISELYSQMMNGLVDVEKDAWIFFIQGNPEVIPVLTYLIKAGVPKKEAIYFVSQPLVRQYVKNQKTLGSIYGKLSKKAPAAPSFIKYFAANEVIEKFVPSDIANPLYDSVDKYNINKLITDRIISSEQYALSFYGKNENGVVSKMSKKVKGKELIEGLTDNLNPSGKGVSHILAISVINPSTGDYEKIYQKATSLVSNDNYYAAATKANTGTFDVDNMRDRLEKGFPIDKKSIDMFLHFIEIEKQIKGIQALKRQSNPDTKTNKTIQEIVEKTVALEDLSDLSKIDPELVEKLRKESILNSFFDNQVVIDLLEPLFKLRNNKRVSQYVTYAISARASEITSKYGKGQDGVRQFINEYKNAVVNYIYQNYMTNIISAQGKVVTIPEIYRGAQVINSNDQLKNNIVYQNGTFYINSEELKKEYEAEVYLDSSLSPNAYAKKGLKPFKTQDDPFDNFASYLRFVMEREFIKTRFPKESLSESTGWLKSRDYETFVNQRALINSFNQKAIMGTEEYSFTKLVQSIIQEYPNLKDKYPVLLQLSEANIKGPEKILTLSNKALAKGDLAESYNLNLNDLADINVKKGFKEGASAKENADTNSYITEVFKMLPIMSVYQNGIGYSKYGINKVLPYDQFLLVIENASINFLNRNLNINTFDNIFDSLFASRDYFKNYVQDSEQYNSISAKDDYSQSSKEEILDVPILDMDIPEFTNTDVTDEEDVLYLDTLSKQIEPSGIIRNRLSDIVGEKPSEGLLLSLYKNYSELMGKNEARKNSVTSFKSFVGYITNSNVIKYKDTYIFGTFDPKKNVFISNINSSPTSKELLAEAIPYISKQFDVIGFAPIDVVTKYKRSGYSVSTAFFDYTFKGEKMQKYMYASNPGISMRLFGKPIEEVSVDEIKSLNNRELALYAYKKVKDEIIKNEENSDKEVLRESLIQLRVPSHIIYNTLKNLDTWLDNSRESADDAKIALEERGEIYNKRFPPKRRLIKKYLEKSLRKLYDFEKINVDPIGFNYLNRAVPEAENELNKLLVNYLASFGIKFEYTDIKEKLGLDSLGVADIFNKIAYVDKNNTEELPNVAGKFIAFMLQYSPLVTETYEALRQYSRYKTSSKDELLDVIGELISEQLHKKTNTEIPKSLLDKIKLIIDYVFNVITKIRANKINRNVGIIVDNVLSRNKSLIIPGRFKPGAEGKAVGRINLQEALDNDTFATDIVNKMADTFILTGSTTLSEQGIIFRPKENQVHDLDWISTLNREDGKKIFEELFPNNIFIREIVNEESDYTTDTWLIAPDGYTIKNIKYKGRNNKVVDYDIVDSKGKVVSKYISKTDSHTGDIGAKAIDIFSYTNVTPEKTSNMPMVLKSGLTLKIASWRNTLQAKINFSRIKDIWDYNRFIPFEYIESDTNDIADKFVDLGKFEKTSKEDGTTADKKMRELADGVLVESVESTSSSQTSLRVIRKKIQDSLPENLRENVIAQIMGKARLVAPLSNIPSPVVMLARNYSLRKSELSEPVKKALDVYINKNAKFIFGNSSTDRAFLDYLHSKNYSNFTIYAYTSGSSDNRITIDEVAPIATESEIEDGTEQSFEDNDMTILNSEAFVEFFNSEILKNPELSVEEVLEYYKKCKN